MTICFFCFFFAGVGLIGKAPKTKIAVLSHRHLLILVHKEYFSRLCANMQRYDCTTINENI